MSQNPIAQDLAQLLQDAGLVSGFGGSADWAAFANDMQPQPHQQFAIWEYEVIPTQTSGSYEENHYKVQISGRALPGNYPTLWQKMQQIRDFLVSMVNQEINGSIFREVTVITAPARAGSVEHEGKELPLIVANYLVVREVISE